MVLLLFITIISLLRSNERRLSQARATYSDFLLFKHSVIVDEKTWLCSQKASQLKGLAISFSLNFVLTYLNLLTQIYFCTISKRVPSTITGPEMICLLNKTFISTKIKLKLSLFGKIHLSCPTTSQQLLLLKFCKIFILIPFYWKISEQPPVFRSIQRLAP